MRIQRGDGVRTPLKKYKNIEFLSNAGLDPLKITKLPSQLSMLGHNRHTSETPFKWRFAGGPMMARLFWYLDPPSPHQLQKKKKKKKKKKKNNNKKKKPCHSWNILTNFSGSAHAGSHKTFIRWGGGINCKTCNLWIRLSFCYQSVIM